MTASTPHFRRADRYTDPRFQPDTILPAQWGHSVLSMLREKGGEYRLLYALLENAVDDYQTYAQMGSHRATRLHQKAADYLFSDDASWSYSAVNICHHLGIDINKLQSGLRAWVAAHQPERPAIVTLVAAVPPSPLGGRPPVAPARYKFHRRRLPGSPYYNAYVVDTAQGITYHVGTYASVHTLTRLAERIASNPNKYGPRYIAGLTAGRKTVCN